MRVLIVEIVNDTNNLRVRAFEVVYVENEDQRGKESSPGKIQNGRKSQKVKGKDINTSRPDRESSEMSPFETMGH